MIFDKTAAVGPEYRVHYDYYGSAFSILNRQILFGLRWRSEVPCLWVPRRGLPWRVDQCGCEVWLSSVLLVGDDVSSLYILTVAAKRRTFELWWWNKAKIVGDKTCIQRITFQFCINWHARAISRSSSCPCSLSCYYAVFAITMIFNGRCYTDVLIKVILCAYYTPSRHYFSSVYRPLPIPPNFLPTWKNSELWL